MIDEKQLDELIKTDMIYSGEPVGCNFCGWSGIASEVIATLQALWKENADLKTLLANVNRELEDQQRAWGKALHAQHLINDKYQAVARAAERMIASCNCDKEIGAENWCDHVAMMTEALSALEEPKA